jgi:GntR family transcriptional regulator, transcriptional repressor for pyruvate dehydrogenase complex
MLQVTERRRLSDIVASRIREYIVSNNLESGDRLPTELELAKQFGVSRVSIREATKALCFLGFLEATPRRGTVFGQIDFRRVAHFLELHPALRNATPRQLIDTRHIVELGMLPHLYDQMRQNPKLYDKFNEFLANFDPTMNVSEWLDLDREFHCLLLDASGLSPLFLFRELVVYFFSRIQLLAQNPAVEEKLRAQLPGKGADHQRIIDLLRDQKLEQAQQELKAHISDYLPILELEAVH